MSQLTYAVTGVSSGIGAELARLLRSAGHCVYGLDINETDENVDVFISLDLNDETSIINAAAAIDRPLDGLCNVAGLPPRAGLEAVILQVNFIAQRQFTQALTPKFNQGASIVNMASRSGHGWSNNIDQIKRLAALRSSTEITAFVQQEKLDATACYNLSKQALILWTVAETENMVNQGFRINSLSPGGIATGILQDFKDAFGDIVKRNIKRAGRAGNATEVAEVAAFVLSAKSYWLKGTDIAIDGGMGAFGMSDRLELDVLRLSLS